MRFKFHVIVIILDGKIFYKSCSLNLRLTRGSADCCGRCCCSPCRAWRSFCWSCRSYGCDSHFYLLFPFSSPGPAQNILLQLSVQSHTELVCPKWQALTSHSQSPASSTLMLVTVMPHSWLA